MFPSLRSLNVFYIKLLLKERENLSKDQANLISSHPSTLNMNPHLESVLVIFFSVVLTLAFSARMETKD